MSVLVIGAGAAGNKAVINLIERGIVEEKDAFLINSTIRDIPEDFKDKAFILDSDGCGKERVYAKKLAIDAVESGKLNFENIVRLDHERVIIISSMEGGTGSGSVPVIAQKIYNDIGINVEIIVFKGFEDDPRGLANSIEFFQDLEPTYTVQVIDNMSFLKEANGNYKKAQKLANDELARRVTITLGDLIVDSEDNIDGTDLYKVTNTAGYTTVEYAEVDSKISNQDQFNQILSEMVDNSHSLTINSPSAQRLAVIMNLQESSQENIDYSLSVLKEKLGNPYETYKHIEYTKNMPEFIAVIASGMKLPIDEVVAIRDRYESESAKTDKTEDDFFNSVRSLKGNAEDKKFDMPLGRRRRPARQTSFSTGKDQITSEKKLNEKSDY